MEIDAPVVEEKKEEAKKQPAESAQ
jgi:hypothetical protein